MNQKVYQLIYRSTALPNIKTEQIMEIVDTAIAFNRQEGITGCLIYDRGHFIQILEGEKDPVDELFKKIKKDARHTNTEILSTGWTKNKIFNSWNMGYIELPDEIKGEKEELARKAKEELAKISTMNDFTSKVFWYNIHSLLTETKFYK
ncbi:BLUF domain-containing protein [Muriicola sp.]|uniref:BLUF domain-containing protein n=1 Tax=Muriicola sp. TaxID=2020856 RepID=UPI003C77F413